jgi:hypothetical protein
MSESVPSPNISEEITRLRTLLSKQLNDAKARLSVAQAGLSAAQTELEAATVDADMAEKQFADYNVLFQKQPAAAAKGNAKPGPVGKSVANATPAKAAKVVVQNKPKGAPGRPKQAAGGSIAGTVPERLAYVMGRRIWTAPELEAALETAGVHLKSGNVKSYISTTLNSSMKNAKGPDGTELKGTNGKPIKVHVFKNVDRGHYRVATAEDTQIEVAEIRVREAAGDDEGETPADELFAKRGIDVRGAMAANH